MRATIVCGHIATGAAILSAVRDEPLESADSGWQFLCGSSHAEDDDAAKVWAVSEVLELEPSLAPFIESPPGTTLTRNSKESPWKAAK